MVWGGGGWFENDVMFSPLLNRVLLTLMLTKQTPIMVLREEYERRMMFSRTKLIIFLNKFSFLLLP